MYQIQHDIWVIQSILFYAFVLYILLYASCSIHLIKCFSLHISHLMHIVLCIVHAPEALMRSAKMQLWKSNQSQRFEAEMNILPYQMENISLTHHPLFFTLKPTPSVLHLSIFQKITNQHTFLKFSNVLFFRPSVLMSITTKIANRRVNFYCWLVVVQ